MYQMGAANASKSTAASAPDDESPQMIWLREEPGARQPGHTRAEITAAALAIADEDGFSAVSMRRVAERLGAGTMTLYHYVESKDELVTLMHDAVAGEALIPENKLASDWRPAMRQIAVRTREVYRRHRWALNRLDDTEPVPNGLRTLEQALAAFADLEISYEHKFELISLVEDYVYGFALREAREITDQERGWTPEVLEFFQQQLDRDEYPELRRLLGADIEVGFERLGALFLGEARFERGLDRLLDGIEAGLEQKKG
jgi:AcrR family transcriptional regulator